MYHIARDFPPTECLLTTRIYFGRDFSVRVGQYGAAVSGRIDVRSGRYYGKVRGNYGLSAGDYDGEIKLESPFSPVTYIFSGAICPTYFVLSTNSDCRPFLVNQPESDDSK